MVTLEKIDQVVERTGVTYEEARAALEEVGGDVLEAIIYLETSRKGFADNMSSNINDKKETIIGVLKELIKKGNITRVIIRSEEKIVLDLPIYIGAVGVFFAPYVALIGAALAALNKYDIVIQTKEDKEYNLNEMTESQLNKFKSAVSRKKKDAPFCDDDVVVDVEEVVEDIVDDVEDKTEQVKEEFEDVVEEIKEETDK
jgi:UBA/TS-N domain protein